MNKDVGPAATSCSGLSISALVMAKTIFKNIYQGGFRNHGSLSLNAPAMCVCVCVFFQLKKPTALPSGFTVSLTGLQSLSWPIFFCPFSVTTSILAARFLAGIYMYNAYIEPGQCCCYISSWASSVWFKCHLTEDLVAGWNTSQSKGLRFDLLFVNSLVPLSFLFSLTLFQS